MVAFTFRHESRHVFPIQEKEITSMRALSGFPYLLSLFRGQSAFHY